MNCWLSSMRLHGTVSQKTVIWKELSFNSSHVRELQHFCYILLFNLKLQRSRLMCDPMWQAKVKQVRNVCVALLKKL